MSKGLLRAKEEERDSDLIAGLIHKGLTMDIQSLRNRAAVMEDLVDIQSLRSQAAAMEDPVARDEPLRQIQQLEDHHRILEEGLQEIQQTYAKQTSVVFPPRSKLLIRLILCGFFVLLIALPVLSREQAVDFVFVGIACIILWAAHFTYITKHPISRKGAEDIEFALNPGTHTSSVLAMTIVGLFFLLCGLFGLIEG